MSATTETEDQTVVCNLISQRNRFLSLLTPPARYTPVSPYPTYTKPQLDMRRKVEILQYKKNSTQLYQTTKTQKWSQLATAKTTRFTICNKDQNVASPSSACDVPGPLIYLSYDPTVPLYNYATNQNTYAMFYTSPEVTWDFLLSPDISGGAQVAALEGETEPQEGEEGYEIVEYEATPNQLIGTLMIQNIRDLITTYRFTIPIGLFMRGTTIGDPSGVVLNTQIIAASLKVYFYSDTVAEVDPSSPPLLTIPITNALTNTNLLDLSMSVVPTVVGGAFSASQFIGDIIVPEIRLNTVYGFLYDFRLYAELQYQPANTPVVNHTSVEFGVYMNMPPYDISANGCIVVPQGGGGGSLLTKYLPVGLVQTGPGT